MSRHDDHDDLSASHHHLHLSEMLSKPTTTVVHVTALDGLVSVNSLFTVAVFVGLSLATPQVSNSQTLNNRPQCVPGINDASRLMVFEVLSFSFFLFSSLVAQGLKLSINILNANEPDEPVRARISNRVLRLGMLGSAAGSVLGCLFLLLSMVEVVQIKLGLLSCGGEALKAVVTLVSLVSVALVGFLSTIIYAFTH